MRPKLRHKYGAKRSRSGDISFPSKLERDCYNWLVKCKDGRRIRNLFRQVPIDIPGGKHVVDFLVFTEDEALFIEAKGRDLSLGKLKRQAAEESQDIDIHVVKSVQELEILIQSRIQVSRCF